MSEPTLQNIAPRGTSSRTAPRTLPRTRQGWREARSESAKPRAAGRCQATRQAPQRAGAHPVAPRPACSETRVRSSETKALRQVPNGRDQGHYKVQANILPRPEQLVDL